MDSENPTHGQSAEKQTDKVSYIYYAFQYPLDFGADMTHVSYLTGANFRSIATYFDQNPSTKNIKLVACVKEGGHSTLNQNKTASHAPCPATQGHIPYALL